MCVLVCVYRAHLSVSLGEGQWHLPLAQFSCISYWLTVGRCESEIEINFLPPCLYLFVFSMSFCSASAYTGAKSDQPQLNRHPGELASSAHQAEPRSGVCIQTFLSYSCRQHSHLCGATSEQHWISPGRPAAWHHLPASNGCSNPCGLVWALGMDIPPYT